VLFASVPQSNVNERPASYAPGDTPSLWPHLHADLGGHDLGNGGRGGGGVLHVAHHVSVLNVVLDELLHYILQTHAGDTGAKEEDGRTATRAEVQGGCSIPFPLDFERGGA
jgi:hypothetical protein